MGNLEERNTLVKFRVGDYMKGSMLVWFVNRVVLLLEFVEFVVCVYKE